MFTAEKFKADVTKTPDPALRPARLQHYLYIGVQFSRGCPFTCEFCDIIELYGRVPRTKTTPQMLAELEPLYDLGYRGHVDFVDDNLIGNKKTFKLFLPQLIAWQEEHGYPFEFSTEASMNLADDDELLQLMRDANFFAVFIGIESPDPTTLIQTQKKQNTKRTIAESVHKHLRHGMFVTAGFIVGFDTEKDGIAQGDDRLHRGDRASRSAWSACSTRCPNTQLTRRLEKEGRLHESHDIMRPSKRATSARTAATSRPCARCATCCPITGACWRTFTARRPMRAACAPVRDARPLRAAEAAADGDIRKGHGVDVLYKIINALPEAREPFWETFVEVAQEESRRAASRS